MVGRARGRRRRLSQLATRMPIALAVLTAVGSMTPTAHAGTCSVPGTHPTIQEAISDPACSTIDLQATTYSESIEIPRSLSVHGPGGGGAIIEGLAQVVGSGTQVSFSNLVVRNGCLPDGVLIEDGAELGGTNFAAISDPALACPEGPTAIFGDGFESGDTSAWTVTVP